MDLHSSNGTFLNGKRLEPNKYYEIWEKDIVKFGHSTRDYVFLTEESVQGGGDKKERQADEEVVPESEEEKKTKEKQRNEHLREGEAQFEERHKLATLATETQAKLEAEKRDEEEYRKRKALADTHNKVMEAMSSRDAKADHHKRKHGVSKRDEKDESDEEASSSETAKILIFAKA